MQKLSLHQTIQDFVMTHFMCLNVVIWAFICLHRLTQFGFQCLHFRRDWLEWTLVMLLLFQSFIQRPLLLTDLLENQLDSVKVLSLKHHNSHWESMNHQADILYYSHTTFFNVSHERCKSSKLATDSNVGSYNSWIGALVSVPLPTLKKQFQTAQSAVKINELWKGWQKRIQIEKVL